MTSERGLTYSRHILLIATRPSSVRPSTPLHHCVACPVSHLAQNGTKWRTRRWILTFVAQLDNCWSQSAAPRYSPHSSLFQSAGRSILLSRRGKDRLQARGRLSLGFACTVSTRRRATIYPANISRLFFHSVSSLLFSNHRSDIDRSSLYPRET